MEIIQNEIISLDASEKAQIATIFANIITNIKTDIVNQ